MKILKILTGCFCILCAIGFRQAIAQNDKASFNCGKAKGFVEQAICTNPELSQLDGLLNRVYQNRLRWPGVDEKITRREQIKWLKQRNLCSSGDCIKQAYRERLIELCGWGMPYGAHPMDCPDEFMYPEE